MPAVNDRIVKSEIFLKISVTNKKLAKLSDECFPTAGPYKIIALSRRILERIISRCETFTTNQLVFIKSGVIDFIIQLISQIECSTIKNVTWSTIPAYNMLFKSLLDDTEYIIVPQWEENYGIWNMNLIEHLKDFIRIPGLIFDPLSSEKIEQEIDNLCSDIPSGVYIILYSRLEKLSALHLALLGHEIGHIFASKWMKEEYSSFVTNTKLIERIKVIVEELIKKQNLQDDMFKEILVKEGLENYTKIVVKNYQELLSDIFGCALFGHTYIIASYLFSALSTDIEKTHWDEGYLSWKFRFQNCERYLSYVKKRNPFSLNQDLSLYDSIISDIRGAVSDNQAHPTCNLLIEAYRLHEEEIFDKVSQYAGGEIFTSRIDDEQITIACNRLVNSIVPNAFLSDNNEHPIDIRNILYAIWLVCYRDENKPLIEYSNSIQLFNMLGIKGIELSIEQRLYNDSIERADR